MNSHDMKQLELALQRTAMKAKVTSVDELPEASVMQFDQFKDRNGEPFRLYAYRRGKSKKIFLTDAGQILKTLQKSGMGVELGLLQRVLRSFDLTMLEDGSVLEQTNRPLGARVVALFQGWATADGVLRTWTLPKDQ